MKKGIATALSILLSAQLFFVSASGLGNFQMKHTYEDGMFVDVHTTDWFYKDVVGAYAYGLANGTSESEFTPYGLVSVGEAVAFSVRLYQIYTNGQLEDMESQGGEAWYMPYVRYAQENGILERDQFTSRLQYPATRGEVAFIFGRTLPYTEFENINTSIAAIPDMDSKDAYYNEAIMLFRSGVLMGKDEYGNFHPTENITRAELAVMLNRIVDKGQRKHFVFTTPIQTMNAEQIAALAEPSVFKIELFNQGGIAYGSGSGFFIEPSGIAVTNYHVIAGALTAQAQMADGSRHEITKVLGYNKDLDLAIVVVDGGPYPALELGDSDQIKNGQKIFCVGSPKGLDNTISEGIVSNSSRMLESSKYIQISAPISPGSSGGAVFNDRGQVIGISSGGIEDGQNLNLAIPVNFVSTIERDEGKTIAQVTEQERLIPGSSVSVYLENDAIPDYSSITGAKATGHTVQDDVVIYQYPPTVDHMIYYLNYLYRTGWAIYKIEDEADHLTYFMVKGSNMVGVSALAEPECIQVTFSVSETFVDPEKDSTRYYPGTKAPDYNYITKLPLQMKKAQQSGGHLYVYQLNEDSMKRYMEELVKRGFVLMESIVNDEGRYTQFRYTDGETILSISAEYKYGETWIIINDN